jgi:hypothetical protein
MLCYVDFAHRLVSLNNLTKKHSYKTLYVLGSGTLLFFITHFPFSYPFPVCGDIVCYPQFLIDSDKIHRLY